MDKALIQLNENNKLCCLSVTDIYTTLKTTFNFIKDNQVDINGNLNKVLIFLEISLLNNQGTLISDPRETAFNSIIGFISVVGDTSLKVISDSVCANKYEEYTIAYSDISNFYSSILSEFFYDYSEIMNKLPLICESCNNPYYNMLTSLNDAINLNLALDNKEIYVIYNGLSSLGYSPSSYTIIKNLIIINNSSIVPITNVNGFFIKSLIK